MENGQDSEDDLIQVLCPKKNMPKGSVGICRKSVATVTCADACAEGISSPHMTLQMRKAGTLEESLSRMGVDSRERQLWAW